MTLSPTQETQGNEPYASPAALRTQSLTVWPTKCRRLLHSGDIQGVPGGMDKTSGECSLC